jgi:hypothetical protein
MKKKTIFCSLIITIIFAVSLVYAAEVDVIVNKDFSFRSLSDSDIQKLKPYKNPLKPPDISKVVPDTSRGPYPGGVMTKVGIIDNTETRALGSFKVPYTTTRAQDGATSAPSVKNSNRQSTIYPYRTIGKLTFNQGYCSASVIRQGVIVTAAHCIQNFGSGNNTFSNWKFIPGHYGASGATSSQIRPYGEWNWFAFARPTTWANGTDKGNGAARDNDLAVIILKKDESGRFIGQRTGYLGYGWNNYSFSSSSNTGNKNTAAVSTLGYPALLDFGKIMQRKDGPAYTTILSNAGQIYEGSNFTGGSSGGPWIVNFRTQPATRSGGAVEGTASIMAVVGVTSWGASDPNNPKDNWSSQFRQNSAFPNSNYGGYGAGNIAALLDAVCNTKVPGASTTFKQQGYCN